MKPAKMLSRARAWLPALFAAALLAGAAAETAAAPALSKGQTVYVPFYTHVFIGKKPRPFHLVTTLSIRNVDPRRAIVLRSVDLYDAHGKLMRRLLPTPKRLGALDSAHYVVDEDQAEGDPGANFLVVWRAETVANAPIIESVMIGAQGQQGISFVSRGEVVEEIAD